MQGRDMCVRSAVLQRRHGGRVVTVVGLLVRDKLVLGEGKEKSLCRLELAEKSDPLVVVVGGVARDRSRE